MKKHLLFALILLFFPAAQAHAQASTWFDSPAFRPYVDYAVQAGRLQMPFVLTQPYTTLEVRRAAVNSIHRGMPAWQQHWLRLLVQEIATYHKSNAKDESIGYGYLGSRLAYRGLAAENHEWTEYRAELEGRFTTSWAALAHRTAIDQHFKRDPDYFGDTGEWIYGRVETGYLALRYKGAGFFVGRLGRNWGLPAETSLILSDHPYSYDAAGVQLESRRFRFSFYASRLNDMLGIDTQTDSTQRLYRRFWSIKRFDVALLPNLQLGFSEATVYGAVDGTWEMSYLNPLGLVYIEQRNNRVQMNGLWCADLFWKPAPQLTLFAQYLIDDIIVNNEPGQDDRAKHPDRMGITARLVISDLPAPGSQLGIAYTRIGNWTYMSYRNYENYISNGMGMGYPANSIERVGVHFDYFGWKGWIAQLQASHARQGSQDMTIPFGDTRAAFPIGTVSHWTRGEVSLAWVPSIWWDARIFAAIDHLDSPAREDFFRIGAVLHVKYGMMGAF